MTATTPTPPGAPPTADAPRTDAPRTDALCAGAPPAAAVPGAGLPGASPTGDGPTGDIVPGPQRPGPSTRQPVGDSGPLEVLIQRLDPDLPPPAYAQPSDAGADLVTAQDVTLAPGERAVVGTGLSVALPEGYAAFVHPRSGLAARHGLSVVNAPGTVDAGYRGEVKVILINTDRSEAIALRRGDRVAQLVVQRVEHAVFREVDLLPESVRGAGGLGSTGGFGQSRDGGPRREGNGVRSGS
ncbi:dUTP diphosphatase [Parafrankia discariae]|uniref:dUTP diphosphatase n=1 Tax=Parafrankia discariae TaxID=365528 RepID=UPI00037ACEDC|nr:dUTP diphosphatase [Parafrankia discariae]